MKKRIFISTNETLHGLFGDEENTELERMVDDSNLSLLKDNDALFFNKETKKFDTNSIGSDIIILKDDLEKITTITINNQSDYHLHHSGTSSQLKGFKIKKLGKHNLGNVHFYESVFKIIFDDKNNVDGNSKAEQIIKLLFKEAEVTIGGDTQNKDVLDEYRNLFKQLTLDYITLKKSKSDDWVSEKVKNHLLAVNNYFKQENLGLAPELQALQNLTDIKEFYEKLTAIHTAVDNALFNTSNTSPV